MQAETDKLPPRDGPVVLGVDLGGSRSMSAASAYWPPRAGWKASRPFPATPAWRIVARLTACQGAIRRWRGAASCAPWATRLCPWARLSRRSRAFWTGKHPPQSWAIGSDMPSSWRRCAMRRWIVFLVSGAAWAGATGPRMSSDSGARCSRARSMSAPSLLLRSAFADAITVVDVSGNHKLAKARSDGPDRRGGGNRSGRGAGHPHVHHPRENQADGVGMRTRHRIHPRSADPVPAGHRDRRPVRRVEPVMGRSWRACRGGARGRERHREGRGGRFPRAQP